MGDMLVCDNVCLGVMPTSGLPEGTIRVALGKEIYGHLNSSGRLCFYADKGFQELKCLQLKLILCICEVVYFGVTC